MFILHSNVAITTVMSGAFTSRGKSVACQLLPFLFKQGPPKLVDDEHVADISASPCASLSFLSTTSSTHSPIQNYCAAIRDLLECWIDFRAWLQPLISGHAQSTPFDSWQWTDDSQARLITAN